MSQATLTVPYAIAIYLECGLRLNRQISERDTGVLGLNLRFGRRKQE